MNVATSSKQKLENGTWAETTTWHRVVAFGKVAENCAQYLHKSSLIFVDGRLETEKWDDDQGKTRYSASVIANQVQFLDKKEELTVFKQKVVGEG